MKDILEMGYEIPADESDIGESSPEDNVLEKDY